MYSFYNVTFQGLGCAAWVREGGFFSLGFGWGFFWLFFLKNSTIYVEFGTHLRKTAQSTNTGEKTVHTRERDKRGQGEHKEETRGEGSPVVILLLAQSGRDRGNTHPWQGDGP